MLISKHSIGIVKCSHCKKILASEEFDNHKCELELVGVKSISIINYSDVSYKDKKLIEGWGVDGILYTFEVVPRKPIPYIIPLSDEGKRFEDSDGEVTEPARVRGLMVVSYYLRNEKKDGVPRVGTSVGLMLLRKSAE